MNPALFPPREIDVEILPVVGVDLFAVALHPRLDEIVLESEDRRQDRRVSRRELGCLARGGVATFLVRACVKTVDRPIVFPQAKPRRIDGRRLAAVELVELWVAVGDAAVAAPIDLKIACLQLLDEVMERSEMELAEQPDRVQILLPQRGDLA